MNNRQIIISGGGEKEDSYLVDKTYFDLLKNNSKILYIPIALKAKDTSYEECYDWFVDLISLHSNSKEIDFTMLLEDDDIPDLNNYDSIYVGGGNTYKLLNFVYTKRIDSILIDYIKNGGLYYGGSAGGIILGRNIDTVKEENIKNYKYSNGLSMVGNYSIYCHYEKNADERLERYVLEYKNPVIALPENMGIIVNEHDIRILGNDSIAIFNFKEKKILYNYSDFEY
jgi:dipeptidase E